MLDLSYNHLGPDGAQLIGAFLAGTEAGSLAHLSVVLGFNKIVRVSQSQQTTSSIAHSPPALRIRSVALEIVLPCGGKLTQRVPRSLQTHDGARFIATALRRPVTGESPRPVLGELNLRNNNLRPEGAEAIADAIRRGRGLSCPLHALMHGASCRSALCKCCNVVQQHCPLSTRVGADGCAMSVRSLILYNDHLLAKGAQLLADALEADRSGKWNPFLEHIDLSSNCLGTAGGCAIARALTPRVAQGAPGSAYNSTLRSVKLHRNNISDGGAEARAPASSPAPTFRRADALSPARHLSRSRSLGGANSLIGPASSTHQHLSLFQAFAALIAENTALASLVLSNNHIHDIGGAHIQRRPVALPPSPFLQTRLCRAARAHAFLPQPNTVR